MSSDDFNFNLSQQEYDSLYSKFQAIVENEKEEVFDINDYTAKCNFDIEIVSLMENLRKQDQLYRGKGGDMEQQQEVDAETIKIVDSLYNAHNS